jgi:outer membrane protein OmpA-like peptidoglycan-associated protein
MTSPCRRPRDRRLVRPLHAAAAGAAAVALAVTLSMTSAQAAPDDTVPHGVVQVAGQDVPVLGTFVYHEHQDDARPEVRGVIHGVRRIDGGTVVYYSLGSAGGDSFRGSSAFPDSSSPYRLNRGVAITIVDTTTLHAYVPLHDDATTFASDTGDLNSNPGELRVGWAVFPELPASVTTVQVNMPWGTAAGEIPVQDGALTPVSAEPAPYVGEGWPQVPQGTALANADQKVATFPLTRRSSDLQKTAQVDETPEQTSVTLDANVLFAKNSAELSSKASATLAKVAADIAARGTGTVVVTGHTDSDGSDASNQKLSEQRAASVVAALEPQAGSAVTFKAVGKGESEPVATNSTPEGQQQNRRVTVVYSVKGDAQ